MIKRRKNSVPPPPPDCPLRKCMELLSGAWTPDIIWYLRDGERRFNELQTDLPGVSAKMLTARLKRLERLGVILRSPKPTSPPTVWYGLTPLGIELVGALSVVVNIGHRLKQNHEGAFETAGPP